MKHEIRALERQSGQKKGGYAAVAVVGTGTHGEIGQVDGCPGNVWGHTGNGIDCEFSSRYEDNMDHPCT